MIPLPITSALVAGAIGAAGAWTFQANRYDARIATLKTEYATTQFQALEKAHAENIRLQEKKDEALKAAQVRQLDLARAAAGARAALLGLSDATASALRDAEVSHAACVGRATAFKAVFDQCAGSYGRLAQDADAIASDRQTMIEAWPK